MTENLKPTSKVIQISSNIVEQGRRYIECSSLITVLCENGSIWQRFEDKWTCILEVPKLELPPILRLPEDGIFRVLEVEND
jgi:hypothetical protein